MRAVRKVAWLEGGKKNN